jgi:hypothetical protein
MSERLVLRVVLFLAILLLRPLGYLLCQGRVDRAVKDFVYDID